MAQRNATAKILPVILALGTFVSLYQNCAKVRFAQMPSASVDDNDNDGDGSPDDSHSGTNTGTGTGIDPDAPCEPAPCTGDSPTPTPTAAPNPTPSPTPSPTPDPVKRTLSLGIMTKNMACVMCHTRVTGDISGFGTMTFRNDSRGTIYGNIFAADQKLQHWTVEGGVYVLDRSVIDTVSNANLIASVLPDLIPSNLVVDSMTGEYRVRPGERHNTFSTDLKFIGGGLSTMTSNDPVKRKEAVDNIVFNPFTNKPVVGEADFPRLDTQKFGDCAHAATDYIKTADGQIHRSPLLQNSIFVNGRRVTSVSASAPAGAYNDYDPSCPAEKTIEISGEVVVQGDLVLAGCVRGRGTVYAMGSIYVPNDIKVTQSAFPFPVGVNPEAMKADVAAKAGKDMLSLGAEKFIVIGSFRNKAVITHEEQDPIFKNSWTIFSNLTNWLSNGTSDQNLDLYERSFLKKTFFGKLRKGDGSLLDARPGSVALVEANLYANMGIATTQTSNNASNIVVNGSVITPNLQFLVTGYAYQPVTTTGTDLAVNPFNQMPFNSDFSAYLNQDFRLRYGDSGYACHRIR